MPTKRESLYQQSLASIREVLELGKARDTLPLSKQDIRNILGRLREELVRENIRARRVRALRKVPMVGLVLMFLAAWLPEGARNPAMAGLLLLSLLSALAAGQVREGHPAHEDIVWIQEQMDPLSNLPGAMDDIEVMVEESRACRRYLDKVRAANRKLVRQDYDILQRLYLRSSPDAARSSLPPSNGEPIPLGELEYA